MKPQGGPLRHDSTTSRVPPYLRDITKGVFRTMRRITAHQPQPDRHAARYERWIVPTKGFGGRSVSIDRLRRRRAP